MNAQLCDDTYWREFASALRALVGPAALFAALGGALLTLPATATAESCRACLTSPPDFS